MATATLKPPINLPGEYTNEVEYGRAFSAELTLNFLNYVAGARQVEIAELEDSVVPGFHGHYLEHFRPENSLIFEDKIKPLTSIPP